MPAPSQSLWVIHGCALLSLALPACNTNRPFHAAHPVDQVECHHDHSVPLGFVEFDDHGEFWSRSQYDSVQKELVKQAKKGRLLLIVYVHGWNNNAAPNNRDLEQFKELLKGLSSCSRQIGGLQPFGVYMGWRGKTFAQPIYLDFWHSQARARRVAWANATEALWGLGSSAHAAQPSNKVIMLGHSFGGLVLERCLTQALVSKLSEREAEHRLGRSPSLNMKVPFDLAMMVNEAESAVFAGQLISQMKASQEFTNSPRPLLVSVSSKGDKATNVYYPFGTFLGRLYRVLNPHNAGAYRSPAFAENTPPAPPGNQEERLLKTAPHFEALRSHELVSRGKSQREVAPSENRFERAISSNSPSPGRNNSVVETEEGPFELRRIPGAYNDTAYWVLHVPKSIIKSHGDIWNADVVGLMTALFSLRK